jgi:hypothetical protein
MYNEYAKYTTRMTEIYQEYAKGSERMTELYKELAMIADKMTELYKETAGFVIALSAGISRSSIYFPYPFRY